jgi:hypothetical protein
VSDADRIAEELTLLEIATGSERKRDLADATLAECQRRDRIDRERKAYLGAVVGGGAREAIERWISRATSLLTFHLSDWMKLRSITKNLTGLVSSSTGSALTARPFSSFSPFIEAFNVSQCFSCP